MKNKIILCTLLATSSNVFAVKTVTAVVGTGVAAVIGFAVGAGSEYTNLLNGKEVKNARTNAALASSGINIVIDNTDLSEEDTIKIAVSAVRGAVIYGGITGVVLTRKTPAWRLRLATKGWQKLSCGRKMSYSEFHLKASAIDASLYRAEADATNYWLARNGSRLKEFRDHVITERHNARVSEFWAQN